MEWYKISELLNLGFRWFHIVAGISWIGQTYLFNWMERTLPLEVDSDADENVSGQLWMVHGGGFYLVEKQTKPKVMPRTLHWFKWESALTWISGFFLLIIIYYMGGLMLEPDSEMSELTASLIGISVLVLGFGFYRLLWSSPLGKNEYVGYNQTYKTQKKVKIAILGIGYGDGISRILSNNGDVMYKKETFKIIGRISMDSLTIDITKSKNNMKTGQYCEIINKKNDIEKLAKKCGTISNEILTSISQRVRRVYI